MVDLLFTYDTPVPGSYGDVYLRAAQQLEKKGVTWACLDLEQFVQEYDLSDEYLQKVSEHFRPQLILSHHRSLDNSLRSKNIALSLAQVLKEEIENFFVANYWGKIQTDSPYCSDNSVEFKEGFIQRMRAAGISHPKTILRDEVAPKDWNYTYLNAQLNPSGNGFYLKDVTMQRSLGVHYIDADDKFKEGEKIRIAQRKVTPDGQQACSLRIVTFPNHILGGSFRYSIGDYFHSNSQREGKIPIDTGNGITPKISSEMAEMMQRTGLTAEGKVLPEVLDLALKVSSLPSQSLLRGIDIVFDTERKPYFLEAQTGPGNPWEGSYPLIMGKKPGSEMENVNFLSSVVADCLYRHLNRK